VNLTPDSQKAIASRARAQLKAVRRRLNDTRDLGYSLAAAKLVVATLQAQAEKSGVPQSVIDIGDELAGDLELVTKWLKR
jgi:SpoU rRNA methylase family enzyme